MSRKGSEAGAGLVLSQTDARPMYLQIVDQVQQKVAVGDWASGTKLPSIRELAVELKVSVITVKRAYLELERGGVIVTQHGKGSFVSDAPDRNRIATDEIERLFDRVAELATALGLSAGELEERLAHHLRKRGT